MKTYLVMIGALGMLSMMVPLNVFASENNTNLLSPSLGNMSLSQALRMGDLIEQARNYSSNALQTADGNFTKLYSILLNDSVTKGFLTEKEKDTLSPYLMGLTQNDSAKHLSIFKKDISTLLEGMVRNNSSINLISLTSILNNTISNIDNKHLANNTMSDFVRKNVPVVPLELTVTISDDALMCIAGLMMGVGLGGGMGAAVGASLAC